MSPKIVGRVVVGVSGSPGSLEALRFALGQARLLGAALVPVLAWQLPGGPVAGHRAAPPHLVGLSREFAAKNLFKAFEEGLGGLPDDVRTEPWVIEGPAGEVLVDVARKGNDLLVVGAGRRGGIGHALRAGTARHCLAHALCPVIAVPPPRLQADLSAHLRRRHEINRLLDEAGRTPAR